MPPTSPDTRAFAREHHLRYEVAPEEVLHAGRREAVGFDVRVFASHDGASLGAPACPRCLELLEGLRAFAGEVARAAGASAPIQIVDEPGALYESREGGTRDEVSVTIRVGPYTPDAREESAELGGLRRTLEGLGASTGP